MICAGACWACRSRIEAAAKRSGRTRDAIKLIAVSKTHPAEVVRPAIEAGATDLGENRVQEAEPKIETWDVKRATWHLIGHLQSNKARRAVQLFDMIHSLDSVALVEKLDRACEELQREELPVLDSSRSRTRDDEVGRRRNRTARDSLRR